VSAVHQLRTDGALVIDVRPVTDYAAGHIPGAVSIPLRAQFATWLGWLIPPDTPLVILRGPDQDPAEVAWQALKIGYDRLAGELDGGIDAWTVAGQPTARTELLTPDRIGDRHVLDIRQRPEFTAGHLPDAVHVELGALGQTADRLRAGPTVVMCGHGERAAGAASLLERAGHRNTAILVGGPDDWATATDNHLQTGS
jgi:rhodanese-related sulfurtransferase